MFSDVSNARIKSLTEGAVVRLRFGKAAVRSSDDVVTEAKLLRHESDGDKSLAIFEETSAEGQVTEITVSRFPGAVWKEGNKYVSIVAVDESTFTLSKGSNSNKSDAISKAIELVTKEHDDVYGADQLVDLLNQIQTGNRVPASLKALANKLANKLVDELSSLTDQAPAPTA